LRYWVYLVLLWIVGIDLRLTLLGVPPVIPQIHHDLALNEAAVGALTAMPVLLLGIAAIGGSLMIAKIGARRATIAGLLLVAVAGALRGVGPNTATLFAMTFVMGAGIAVCQPAAPTLIGAWFPQQIGFATAVYVNGILVGEALAAALAIPVVLPLVHGSWEWSLAVWSIPVALTPLCFRLFVAREVVERDAPPLAWFPDWRDPLTWQLGLMQGGISVLYFGLNAYVPDFFHAVGRPWMATPAIATLNLMQLPGSFATLFVAQRLAGRRLFFIAVLIAAIPGLAFLLVGPDWLALVGIGLFGMCSAIGLSMIVALPPMLTEQNNVHRLSAGMFTIGYIGSFAGTLLGGVLWDATRVPATAFIPVLVGAALVALLGSALKRRTAAARAA
jgi:CP family cyanate transporter-like MFS transporter